MADHVCALQGDEARGLNEVDVHADQERDAPDRRVEYLMAEIARRRPFRLGNIKMPRAGPAQPPVGSGPPPPISAKKYKDATCGAGQPHLRVRSAPRS